MRVGLCWLAAVVLLGCGGEAPPDGVDPRLQEPETQIALGEVEYSGLTVFCQYGVCGWRLTLAEDGWGWVSRWDSRSEGSHDTYFTLPPEENAEVRALLDAALAHPWEEDYDLGCGTCADGPVRTLRVATPQGRRRTHFGTGPAPDYLEALTGRLGRVVAAHAPR